MRRTRRGFLVASAALVFLFALSSMASAGVSKVLCVPWNGDLNLQHTAISGQSVGLFAVIYGDSTGGTFNYSWDFKDSSSPATGSVNVPANGIANLQVSHTFTGFVGTVFPTSLTVAGVSSNYKIILASDINSSKVNIAIDKGLWWLHTQMTRDNYGNPSVPGGRWCESGYCVGNTGASVWAFEVQGHLLSVEANPLSPVVDPYVEDVQRGVNFLLTRLFPQTMDLQNGNNPDSNHNGYGLVCYWDSGHTDYENGIAMGAIAGCGTLNATAATAYDSSTQPYVMGRKYGDILQDMADWYAWSQIEATYFPPSGPRGGWYYYACDNCYWGSGSGDNSASQWAYIGLESAQNVGCTIPAFVKADLAKYLHGQISSYGGFVSYRENGGTPDVTLTGGALVGMAFVGQPAYDAALSPGAFSADMGLVKTFLGNNWLGQDWRWTENWYGHRAYYAMYALMKGMRLNGITSLPGAPGTPDWYNDYVGVMLPGNAQGQYADGHWYGAGWMDTGYIFTQMGTAFGVLILTPSVFSPPPVACFTAKPNPTFQNMDISFDPSCSYHSDHNKSLVWYEWDWGTAAGTPSGIYTNGSPNPQIVKHQFPLLQPYTVTLRVTDNSVPTPVTATAQVDVKVTLPPHPPVSNPGGPYVVSLCAGDILALDGTASFNPDEGKSESGSPPFSTIIAWDWDLDGAPWDYTNESGSTVTLPSAKIAAYFPTPGTDSIGLRVTNNTASAFPGSGKPNLTDEAFTGVTVYGACLCDLTAYPKSGKIQLNWSNSGTAKYNIFRSTQGPNTGFVQIATNYVNTYGVYVDTPLVNGKKYYYRIVRTDGFGSKVVSATPKGR